MKKEINITINNDIDNPLVVQSGLSLLTTLATKNIFLASSCGGDGTCGLCGCRIYKGGGEITLLEKNHLNAEQLSQNKRLACQVKVVENMDIHIPANVFQAKKIICTVVSNKHLTPYIKELILQLPEGQNFSFIPGDFIQLYAPRTRIEFAKDAYDLPEEYKDEFDERKIWDMQVNIEHPVLRAYSMANAPGETSDIRLVIRIATPPWVRAKNSFASGPLGRASSYAFSRKPEDKILITGPYGDFHIRDTQKEMIYIGGGTGIAPLRSHIVHLFQTIKTKRKVSLWYGARNSNEIFYENDFRRIEKENSNFHFAIALSEPGMADKWEGATGMIHEVVLQSFLRMHKTLEDAEFYVCGPPLMLDAVLKMLAGLGISKDRISYDNFGI